MQLSPADFQAWAQATGNPYPTTAQEKAQVATAVLAWKAEKQENLAADRGPNLLAAGLGLAGVGALGVGGVALLNRNHQTTTAAQAPNPPGATSPPDTPNGPPRPTYNGPTGPQFPTPNTAAADPAHAAVRRPLGSRPALALQSAGRNWETAGGILTGLNRAQEQYSRTGFFHNPDIANLDTPEKRLSYLANLAAKVGAGSDTYKRAFNAFAAMEAIAAPGPSGIQSIPQGATELDLYSATSTPEKFATRTKANASMQPGYNLPQEQYTPNKPFRSSGYEALLESAAAPAYAFDADASYANQTPDVILQDGSQVPIATLSTEQRRQLEDGTISLAHSQAHVVFNEGSENQYIKPVSQLNAREIKTLRSQRTHQARVLSAKEEVNFAIKQLDAGYGRSPFSAQQNRDSFSLDNLKHIAKTVLGTDLTDREILWAKSAIGSYGKEAKWQLGFLAEQVLQRLNRKPTQGTVNTFATQVVGNLRKPPNPALDRAITEAELRNVAGDVWPLNAEQLKDAKTAVIKQRYKALHQLTPGQEPTRRLNGTIGNIGDKQSNLFGQVPLQLDSNLNLNRSQNWVELDNGQLVPYQKGMKGVRASQLREFPVDNLEHYGYTVRPAIAPTIKGEQIRFQGPRLPYAMRKKSLTDSDFTPGFKIVPIPGVPQGAHPWLTLQEIAENEANRAKNQYGTSTDLHVKKSMLETVPSGVLAGTLAAGPDWGALEEMVRKGLMTPEQAQVAAARPLTPGQQAKKNLQLVLGPQFTRTQPSDFSTQEVIGRVERQPNIHNFPPSTFLPTETGNAAAGPKVRLLENGIRELQSPVRAAVAAMQSAKALIKAGAWDMNTMGAPTIKRFANDFGVSVDQVGNFLAASTDPSHAPILRDFQRMSSSSLATASQHVEDQLAQFRSKNNADMPQDVRYQLVTATAKHFNIQPETLSSYVGPSVLDPEALPKGRTSMPIDMQARSFGAKGANPLERVEDSLTRHAGADPYEVERRVRTGDIRGAASSLMAGVPSMAKAIRRNMPGRSLEEVISITGEAVTASLYDLHRYLQANPDEPFMSTVGKGYSKGGHGIDGYVKSYVRDYTTVKNIVDTDAYELSYQVPLDAVKEISYRASRDNIPFEDALENFVTTQGDRDTFSTLAAQAGDLDSARQVKTPLQAVLSIDRFVSSPYGDPGDPNTAGGRLAQRVFDAHDPASLSTQLVEASTLPISVSLASTRDYEATTGFYDRNPSEDRLNENIEDYNAYEGFDKKGNWGVMTADLGGNKTWNNVLTGLDTKSPDYNVVYNEHKNRKLWLAGADRAAQLERQISEFNRGVITPDAARPGLATTRAVGKGGWQLVSRFNRFSPDARGVGLVPNTIGQPASLSSFGEESNSENMLSLDRQQDAKREDSLIPTSKYEVDEATVSTDSSRLDDDDDTNEAEAKAKGNQLIDKYTSEADATAAEYSKPSNKLKFKNLGKSSLADAGTLDGYIDTLRRARLDAHDAFRWEGQAWQGPSGIFHRISSKPDDRPVVQPEIRQWPKDQPLRWRWKPPVGPVPLTIGDHPRTPSTSTSYIQGLSRPGPYRTIPQANAAPDTPDTPNTLDALGATLPPEAAASSAAAFSDARQGWPDDAAMLDIGKGTTIGTGRTGTDFSHMQEPIAAVPYSKAARPALNTLGAGERRQAMLEAEFSEKVRRQIVLQLAQDAWRLKRQPAGTPGIARDASQVLNIQARAARLRNGAR